MQNISKILVESLGVFQAMRYSICHWNLSVSSAAIHIFITWKSNSVNHNFPEELQSSQCCSKIPMLLKSLVIAIGKDCCIKLCVFFSKGSKKAHKNHRQTRLEFSCGCRGLFRPQECWQDAACSPVLLSDFFRPAGTGSCCCGSEILMWHFSHYYYLFPVSLSPCYFSPHISTCHFPITACLRDRRINCFFLSLIFLLLLLKIEMFVKTKE